MAGIFENVASDTYDNALTGVMGGTDNTRIGNTGDRLKVEATVDATVIDHNALSNLAVGDVHTQYTKAVGSAVTDNAIVRFDSTTGRVIQNSSATIDDNGGVVAGAFVRPGTTTDTTEGNIRYTNGEMEYRDASVWRVVGVVPSIITATSSASTTSSTFSTINSMTATPAAGTYMAIFSCTANIDNNSDGDFGLFVGGTERTECRRSINVTISGILASGSITTSISILTGVTVNGSQAVEIKFRENASGTLTVTGRTLILVPVSR